MTTSPGCIVEPDAVGRTSSVIAKLDPNDQRPDAIFVLGSDGLLVSSLAETAASPIIPATCATPSD